MSNRAAVYTVAVHRYRRPDARCLLGDFDGNGTALIDKLAEYLPKLGLADEQRHLRCQSHKVESTSPPELLAMMEHGQTGVDAIIRDREGVQQYHQLVDDSQILECGCLFRLPPEQRLGWLAIHIPNRRGIKTLLAAHMYKLFRDDYPELALAITPYVVESALKQAVDNGLIRTVTLVRRVQPSDRAVAGIDQWIGHEDLGKITVTISAGLSGRARHLLADPLRRYIESPDQSRQTARKAIVEFRGMEFDEAKVEIPQGDGTRTFNIERPDAGHPFTEDMRLGEGKPSQDEIFAALREALQTVSA